MDGIDISAYQADLDPKLVPGGFVIIKATGGPGYTNPHWKAQHAAAKAAGKKVGLYHFARDGWMGTTPQEEASHFLTAVQSHLEGTVLVLDWEADNVNDVGWAATWLDIVTAATGKHPLIYMNLSVANTYDWSTVAPRHPLWLAWYGGDKPVTGYQRGPVPTVKHWGTPAIWQYTQRGRLPGYAGDLDLNLAYTNPWGAPARQLLIPEVPELYLP